MSTSTKNPTILGNVFLRGLLRLKGRTFTKLPTAPTIGTITLVTDATTTSGTISAGGSSHTSVAIFDGSVWKTFINLT